MAAIEDEIAVVGLGCRFPGADNLEEYWRVLLNGENHIKDIPNDRWEVDDFFDEDQSIPGKAYVKRAALAKDTNQWDHKLYGINEVEAEFVDPQHRMALDCIHMALEDAGIRRKDIEGTNTAVYMGSMNADFQNSVLMDLKEVNNYTAVGVHNSILSARVAYVYNLHGPAITMDTACSSSLVAIHLGAQALKLGDCDAVICGGVNTITDPTMFIFLSKAKMLSPTGQSQPFSAAANGYARGEGCGIVILKRLKDSIQDGNKIWGLLRTGSNQDGRTATPITAPSGNQQTELLKRIYNTNGINADEVQVIEAHGTGTPVGDPVETNALGRFFSKYKTRDKRFIGTVKSNIGHTEAAAGTAGLIKVLLMMRYGKIVPSLLDKSNINPKIKFEQYGLEVPSEVKQWQKLDKGRRVACVNSFGFGGTNAHVVVHEHVPKTPIHRVKSDNQSLLPNIVAISAHDDKSLIKQVISLSEQLKKDKYDIEALSYTSLCKRDHRNFRKAFAVESQSQLMEQCEAFIQSPPKQPRTESAKLAFIFCGVGTTWEGMCSFMMRFDAFKNAIEEIDSFLFHLTGWTIASKLHNTSNEILSDPLVGHISIFACQVGLVEVWRQFGVKPDIIIGQSVGEVAAAYTSGGIDLESAVKVIYYRSKFLSEVTGGAMAVVKNVETDKIEDICKASDGKLTIAVYNSPTSCTISGDKSAIDLIRKKLTNGLGIEGGVLIDIDVKCAYHSPYVKGAAEKATHFLKDLRKQTTFIPIVSTVTGKEETPDIFSDGLYWRDNTQLPVQFMKAVRAADSVDKNVVYLEIGPGPVLGAHISKLFKNENVRRVLPTMRRKNERGTFINTLCTLHEIGFDISWDRVVERNIPTVIPYYIFRETEIKHKTPRLSMHTKTSSYHIKSHLYIKDQIKDSKDASFKIDIDEESTPFIFDHIVKGAVLVPGAFYADVGFKIGEDILNLKPQEASISLEFAKTAKIAQGSKAQLSVSTFGKTQEGISFRVRYDDKIVVTGKTSKQFVKMQPQKQFNLEKLRFCIMQSNYTTKTAEELYADLDKMGFSYGKCFRIMERSICNESGGVVDFKVPDEVFKDVDRTILHPCILDAMLQSTLIAIDEMTKALISKENIILLPVAVQSIIVHKSVNNQHLVAYTIRSKTSIIENMVKIHYNSILMSTDGTVIAEIRNFTTFSRRGSSFIPDELKYRLSWSELPQLSGTMPIGSSNISSSMVIDLTNSSETQRSFVGSNMDICTLKDIQLSEKSFCAWFDISLKSKSKTIDKLGAIIVLFGANGETSITQSSSSEVYKHSVRNIMILVWLLKHIKSQQNLHIIITTQNTQNLPISVKGDSLNNLQACETWGFIRSVQIEFVHNKITMIDVQPSIFEAYRAYMDLIAHIKTSKGQSRTEYAIYRESIFGASFEKNDVTDMMPMSRLSNVYRNEEIYGITSLDNSKQGKMCLFQSKTADREEKFDKSCITLKVKTLYNHPSEFVPTSTDCGDPSTWDSDNERPSVIGLEYSGFKVQKESKKFYRCNKVDSIMNYASNEENEWEIVAVFPNIMKTCVTVPKDCVVNMKELPLYHPGLLSKLVLFWNVTQHVQYGSTVCIVSDSETSSYSHALDCMLRENKAAKILSGDYTSVDTIVLLGCANYETLKNLQNCKRIICVKRCISEDIQSLLMSKLSKEIIEIDTRKLFSGKELGGCLKKVVAWLKRNAESVRSINIEETTSCTTITKQGHYCLPVRKHLNRLFNKEDIFITTGGLTGLGWQLNLLLAEMGVGYIATISRRKVDPATQTQIEDLQKMFNCKVLCFQGDVCELDAVQNMVNSLINEYGRGRIRGVLHGAGVLDSKLLINLEQTHLETVMKPKILGAMNLHIATRFESLECFIVHSSITSYIGSPGQGNYGAANNFLDCFTRWRRQNGLPAQAINWGALGVGMAAKKEFVDNFAKRGHVLLSITEIRNCFIQALLQDNSEVVYANIDLPTFSIDYFIPEMSRILPTMEYLFAGRIIEPNKSKEKGQKFNFDIDELKEASSSAKLKATQDLVISTAKRVIGGDVGSLTLNSTFGQLGMDSMSAVTFSNVLHQMTSVRINQDIFLDFERTILDVVDLLGKELFGDIIKTSNGTEDVVESIKL